MRNTLLVFVLMASSVFSYGQIIQFADPNFKSALVNSMCVDSNGNGTGDKDADENNDGEIDISEAEKVKGLNIRSQSISNLSGIEFFTALQVLDCNYNQLSFLDVSNLYALQDLWCSNNALTSLDVSNLPALQRLRCSINQLTSLDVSNLPALQELWCTSNNLTSLVVSNLPSLKILNCGANQLTSLLVYNLPALQVLDFSGNRLISVDVSMFSTLKELNCGGNQLTSLDVLNLNDLQVLKCHSNNLTSLNVSNLPALKELECGYNNLTSLEVFILPALERLNCFYNKITSLDISNLPNLIVLNCYENKLTSLVVSNLPALISLNCYGSQLTSLDVSNLLSLKQLYCLRNQLTSLDVSNLLDLQELNCGSNNLTSLDVSNLNALQSLECFSNKLLLLKIKNGRTYYSSSVMTLLGNPTLKYLCCDEKNIKFFEDKIKSYGYTNVEVNTYCSFDPGGVFSDILGKVKYDLDQDGCDDNDIIYPLNKIGIKSSTGYNYVLGDESGNYNLSLNSGTYTIKPEIENPAYYTITPESIMITVSNTLKDTITQNFCITPKGIHKQVDISIIPLTPPARPGFDASYKVVMTNKGNQIENGTLYFAYDEAKMDFVSTDITTSTQSNGLLSWNFTGLLPFETRYYNVTLNVNSPSETPPVNAGDELLITCNILDNVFLLRQEVVGSYDPNDKTCLEGKTIAPEQVGEYVHYLIRFENTGNYAAENVVVKDVIDATTFDISSLQITDASHEAWARINDNIVEFIFENIQLPFDDASNDGYICFKIKTKPTLVLGNELKNEANIYFDYNLPILTNKTNTVVANLVGIDEAIGESGIEIFPNPVSDMLKFSGDDKILKVEIFDMSGRLVQVSSVVNGEVDIQKLSRGIYNINMKSDMGKKVKRFVKM